MGDGRKYGRLARSMAVVWLPADNTDGGTVVAGAVLTAHQLLPEAPRDLGLDSAGTGANR